MARTFEKNVCKPNVTAATANINRKTDARDVREKHGSKSFNP